ncbi:MAG: site-specific integrase [Solimonas sp.]
MSLQGNLLPLPFPNPAPHRPWVDAVERWQREGALWKSERTIELETSVLSIWLNPRFRNLEIRAISDDHVDQLVMDLVAAGVAAATANRVLSVLRALLNAAVMWHWLSHAPKVRHLRDRAKRVRFLSYSEAQRLLIQLPEHLQLLVTFSLETGLRCSNVTGLTWSQVDRRRRVAWIHADQAKGRRAIPVPLSATALHILEQVEGRHHEYVFTYRGKRITQTSTKAWRAALDRAGIKDFRWHDLRHTWASWHAQNGTPLYILQELGGWSDGRMVQNYAHLSTEHLHEYVDKMHDRLRQRASPEWAETQSGSVSEASSTRSSRKRGDAQ